MTKIEPYKAEVQQIFHYLLPKFTKKPQLKSAFLESCFVNKVFTMAELREREKNAETIRKQLDKIAAEKNLQNEAERKKRMSLAANYPRWFRKSRAGDPEQTFLKQYDSNEKRAYLKKIKRNARLYNELFNFKFNEAVYILEKSLAESENNGKMVV